MNTKQGWYSCPTYSDPEKNFRTSFLQSNQSKDVWASFLDKFNEWSEKDLAYKALNQDIDENEEEPVEAVVEDASENE